MVKRTVTGILWFFTVAWGWNYVALMSGLPSFLGLALGTAVSAFVLADPLRLFWPAARNAPGRQAAASLLDKESFKGRV